jgi:hypothetical protein
MEEKTHVVNLDFTLRSGRSGEVEFWRDNGDGTCTRIADGLTLTYARYDDLSTQQYPPVHRRSQHLRWDA